MRKCAFLTTDKLQGKLTDDDALHQPLHKLGWQVTPIAWQRTDVDWSDFDAVIIRSTWNYHLFPEQFLCVLATIDHSSARLENHIELVKWNVEKTYLRDLEQRGVSTVPTLWKSGLHADQLMNFFTALDSAEIVIKPTISASAYDTFRLSHKDADQMAPQLAALFAGRDFMVQPLVQNIMTEGEFSLFYFGGEFSHCVLKTPAQGDFRVQSECGGTTHSVVPEQILLENAAKTLVVLDQQPFYARIDFVRGASGFDLMELELIEPSLFFNYDLAAPERFARAFDRWMG